MPATVIFTPPHLDNETELVPLGNTRNESITSGLRARLLNNYLPLNDMSRDRPWISIGKNTVDDDLPPGRSSFIISDRVGTFRRIKAISENVTSYVFIQGSYAWDWTGDTLFRCWIVLLISILLEIWATTLIKIASDKSDLSIMSFAISLYVISLFGFALALKKIEVSVAYAVWSALGTAAVSVFGIIMFGESCNLKKVISLILIMIGVVGLNLQEDDH